MNDNFRWAAVVSRDASYDGTFVYCVKTTKVFCRPNCKARLARRANVEFFDTPAEAQAAGYRSCKRCQPLLASYTPEADKIKKACDMIQSLPADAPLPGLERLAKEAGLTKHHFHRLFKRETGVTPREYAMAARRNSLSDVSGGSSAGMTPLTPITPFSSNTTVNTTSNGTPLILDDEWLSFPDIVPLTSEHAKQSAEGLDMFVIFYNIIETTFGHLLVAFQNRQMVKIELGSNDMELLDSLELAFPPLYHLHSPVELASAEDGAYFQQQSNAVVEALEQPSGKLMDVPVAPYLQGDMDLGT